MGGGLEADLSRGAVVSLWKSKLAAAGTWRPVLQVADVRPLVDPAAAELRYRVDLSDGKYLQPATLAASLSNLARDGALRRGSVIRVLDFAYDFIEHTPRYFSCAYTFTTFSW